MRYGINCKLCGYNLRYLRVTRFGETTIICCERCEILISYYGPCVALAQCMECGVILEGSPFQRQIFTLPDGKPDLSVGYSHGICVPCAIIKLSTHRRVRKAMQEALAIPMLQPV